MLYQSIDHPWFSDWKVSRTGRFEAIVKFLDDINYDILGRAYADIGCCTGQLCRNFATKGTVSFGFDRDSLVLSIAEHLSYVWPEKRVYYYRHANAIDLIPGLRCGLITCLSLLHHFLWKESPGVESDKFIQWLKVFGSSSDLVVIDTTVEHDSLLGTHVVPLNPSEFMVWMKKEIGVKSIVQLHSTPDGYAKRPMYVYSMQLDFGSSV